MCTAGFCSEARLPLRMPRSRSESRSEAELLGGDIAPTKSVKRGVLASEKERGRTAAKLSPVLEKMLGLTLLQRKLEGL